MFIAFHRLLPTEVTLLKAPSNTKYKHLFNRDLNIG